MPIRPELRKFYGREWAEYRALLIALARGRCTVCGRALPSHMLAGAHTRHNPRDFSQVQIMCFPCHARWDSVHRTCMTRRNRARKHGQLWLFDEVEWAPFPSWAVPRVVLARRQESLFGGEL